jgi:hypothetical protein
MKIFKNLTILSVDNSSGDDNLLFLKDYCREFYRASNHIQAIEIYKEQSPQIIIMDPCFDDVMINFAKEILELNFASYMPKQISKKDLLDGLIKVAKRIDPKFIYLPFHCVWDRDISKLYFFSDEVFLTRKESRFLDLLIRKKGAPCSEDEIIFYVWGDDYDKIVNNTSVRTLIKNLRKKIPKELIKSSYGLGYSIEI